MRPKGDGPPRPTGAAAAFKMSELRTGRVLPLVNRALDAFHVEKLSLILEATADSLYRSTQQSRDGWIISCAKIRDVYVFPIRGDGYPPRATPHRNRGHYRVGGRVDHRDRVGVKIRHVGVFPIRGDGYPKGFIHRVTVATRVGDGGRPFRLQCAKSAACAISGGFLAGGPGFEPGLTESESAPSNYQQ